MKAKTFIDSAKTVIAIEGNAVLELAKQIQPTFDDLCKEIIQLKGKLILMGIGKSGHVAQKISATLSSTGTPAFFIHPTEAAHGDLGMVGKNDAILIFSNSGETKEIIEILPALKRATANIYTVTNTLHSTISKAGKISLAINAAEEACPLDLAPTSSTTIALVFGDALAISLLEARGFSRDDFAKSHPAGQLGKKLTTLVRDIATIGEMTPIVNELTSLKDTLIVISEKKLGLTLVEARGEIVGVFTDGDLRRCLNNDVDIESTNIKEIMTANFKSIFSDDLAIDAAEIMEKNKILSLVVKSHEGEKSEFGIITMHQLLESGII
jgi:arabinose-5-phosphate isomerase